MNVLVFDIETIPDVASGRRLYDLGDLPDDDVAKAMLTLRKQRSGSDFLQHHQHRVVAISLVLRTARQVKVWSLGEPSSDEPELIGRFFEGIERYQPTLVSWNGGGFDLPVLHYRALLHGVEARCYWETGDADREFKWNNYLNRYHARHTDLMDVLSGYQPRAVAPLDQVAVMLGFPGKLGMHGGEVWPAYHEGRIGDIRDYCETDVLNTYLVYLRFEMMRGNLDGPGYEAELDLLASSLKAERKTHLDQFLEAWGR